MASVAFCSESLGFQSGQSGHKPAEQKGGRQGVSIGIRTTNICSRRRARWELNLAWRIYLRTRCNSVDQRSHSFAAAPVVGEVFDRQVGTFSLNPVHKSANTNRKGWVNNYKMAKQQWCRIWKQSYFLIMDYISLGASINDIKIWAKKIWAWVSSKLYDCIFYFQN